jgi:hypothetical protein
MFQLWGINAAQLSLAVTDPGYVDRTLPQRHAGGVYLHWSFWCNVSDPIQRGFCDRALDSYRAEMIGQRRVRDYRFAFYRLTAPDVTRHSSQLTEGVSRGPRE